VRGKEVAELVRGRSLRNRMRAEDGHADHDQYARDREERRLDDRRGRDPEPTAGNAAAEMPVIAGVPA
jgi:hypothetical protein